MKPLLPLAILLALVVSSPAQTSQELLNQAQRAFLSGNLDQAKEQFQTVLQRDPENITARNYLRMIAVSEKKEGHSALEKQLQAVVLDKIELKDATFDAALEYLKQRTAKQTEGKTQVNFVVQIPPATLETKKVTLNLSGIPFLEALRYLCTLANADYKVDKFAVTITPKNP